MKKHKMDILREEYDFEELIEVVTEDYYDQFMDYIKERYAEMLVQEYLLEEQDRKAFEEIYLS